MLYLKQIMGLSSDLQLLRSIVLLFLLYNLEETGTKLCLALSLDLWIAEHCDSALRLLYAKLHKVLLVFVSSLRYIIAYNIKNVKQKEQI
jgi:hypothetical protein